MNCLECDTPTGLVLFWKESEVEVPSCVPCVRLNMGKVYTASRSWPFFHYSGLEFDSLHEVLGFAWHILGEQRAPLGEVELCRTCSTPAVHTFCRKFDGVLRAVGYACMHHYSTVLSELENVYCRVDANNAFAVIPGSMLLGDWAAASQEYDSPNEA